MDFADLWTRCVNEAASADALILYAMPDDHLKGALVEVGAALARQVPVYIVAPHGCPSIGSFTRHPLVHEVPSITAALDRINAALAPAGPDADAKGGGG